MSFCLSCAINMHIYIYICHTLIYAFSFTHCYVHFKIYYLCATECIKYWLLFSLWYNILVCIVSYHKESFHIEFILMFNHYYFSKKEVFNHSINQLSIQSLFYIPSVNKMWDMSDFDFCAKNQVFLGYSTDTFSVKTSVVSPWKYNISDVTVFCNITFIFSPFYYYRNQLFMIHTFVPWISLYQLVFHQHKKVYVLLL